MGVSLLMSTACAYGTRTTTDAIRPGEPAGAVHLNVTNLSGGPMEVYAAGRGTSYRIGTVFPGLSSQFVVRPAMTVNGAVEFVARSGEVRFFRSGPILLAPGAVVDLRLEDNPTLSTATVRP
jgi:hypothetical protein